MVKLLCILIVCFVLIILAMIYEGQLPSYGPVYQEGDIVVDGLATGNLRFMKVTNVRWIRAKRGGFGYWKCDFVPADSQDK